MSRRLGFLAVLILALFVVIAAQAVNIQFFKAASLNASPINPRVALADLSYPRGDIVAADGTILAQSIAQATGPYPYRRRYPDGSLTSGVVGFSGPYYANWGLEAEYNTYLSAHPQPAQSLAQLLSPTSAADSLTLTLYPALNRVASVAMKGVVGADVVLDPRNGAVLGMYANPNYDPTPLTSPIGAVAQAAWKTVTTPDRYGFPPLGLVATQQTFPPGSTFKVITTAAAAVGAPSLLQKSYPDVAYITLPDSNKLLYNSGGGSCGGTVAVMLPESCDPGYASLGLDIGENLLAKTANSFGYNKTPPLDLGGVVSSYFPPAASFTRNQAGLAYSAIGQENVRASALQDALVAAAIANNGVEMTPHLMSEIIGPDGQMVRRYKASVWQHPLTAAQAAQIVPLMVNVAKYGTAAGVFPSNLDVGAKTGTAQTGNAQQNTDDWMIAFAPASNPTVAVAVVMPFQAKANFGATVAGPIAACLVEGALAIQSGHKAYGTSTTCPG